MKTSSKAGFAEHVQAIHEESGGKLLLEIVEPGDMPELIIAALQGNQHAAAMLERATDGVRAIEAAPARKPQLCVSCPAPLRKGRYALVCAYPAKTDPSNGLGFAVCDECGTGHDAIGRKAAAGLRQIWPDSQLAPVHRGGTA